MKANNNCNILEDDIYNEVKISNDEYNDLFNIQQEILNMLALHGKKQDTLNRLCQMSESLLKNSVASIMLINPQTKLISVICAPSVPKEGHEALTNLIPGPKGGSCGNAVFKNKAQYVQNTFADQRWENLRDLAINFNICSCWSVPVQNENKEAIGSFALSSFEHRIPSLFHKKLLEMASSIVSIVLKSEIQEKRINLFSTAMQNASEGMIITNSENKIIEVNQSFQNIYGYKEEELINCTPKVFASGENDKTFYKQMWKDIQRKSNWGGEIVNKRKDGSFITQWMSISGIYDDKRNAQNYLAVFTDLTELKNTQDQLQFMAYHDSLTKLYNKIYLEKIINSNKNYTLLLLNINNFSYINTAYGFEEGDNILVKLAEKFQNYFNAYKVCRINADEFVLLFENSINIEEKIIQIKKYFHKNAISSNKLELNISFSIGAVYGNEHLLRNAALALKKSKESGKNRSYIFDDKEDTIDYSRRESFIKNTELLRDAIKEKRILPYFQGIHNNETNKIKRFEALVRIEKDGEVISPFVFLEPARLSGLLPEITKIVIDKSFQAMQKNDYTVSINITEEDLGQDYLVSYLEENANKYNISRHRVILEILEGISSTGKKNHIKQLTLLKEKGYKIAIDDFGTEYSNFERILDLDIDIIKIDAKYIKDIHTNKKSYEIVKAISYFAKNVNIPCTAEFVHNKEVQDIVKKLGINHSQGYYFSEPKKDIIGD